MSITSALVLGAAAMCLVLGYLSFQKWHNDRIARVVAEAQADPFTTTIAQLNDARVALCVHMATGWRYIGRYRWLVCYQSYSYKGVHTKMHSPTFSTYAEAKAEATRVLLFFYWAQQTKGSAAPTWLDPSKA